MDDTTDKTDKTPEAPAADAPTDAATEFSVPVGDELKTTDDAVLVDLTGKLEARGAELAAKLDSEDGLTDEELDEAEALHTTLEGFAAEMAERATAKATKNDRAAAAVGRFKVADAPAPAADAPAAAPAGGTDDTAELAKAKDADKPDEPAAGGKENEAVVAAAPRTSFRGASPAFLRSKARNVADVNTTGEKAEFMVATGFSKDVEGTEYQSASDVANALWRKRMSFGNIPHGTNEMLSIATGTKTFVQDAPMLGLDPQQNLVALRDIQEALVASGEFCTPQTQLYDFFRLAQPIRDVEDAIPTAQAPRGGIRFIQANCTVGGAGAIGSYTYDPDTPGGPDSEDPEFEKPCDRVTCPEIGESLVEAITQCTIFDNLQYRTFPELIEDFMSDVAVQFTLKKQRYYLDKIDAASTATTGIGSYGAARSLFYDWMIAAVAYRKRHHMPRGANLTVFAPDWAMDVIKADMFNDGDSGLDYLNIPDSAVMEGLRSRNLDVTWYYDDPTSFIGQNPLFASQAGAKADLNDFAAEVVSFMFAPGTFVKLDGGSLDLGLVRDHTLNKTNDFAMFMEEWLGFAMLGCESVRIDSLVCPSGSRAPYAEDLRVCPAAVS